MGRLVQKAADDENIKVILIHGGLFYTSGNDLTVLMSGASMEDEEKVNLASDGAELKMVLCLRAILHSKKPIVGLVRGQCIGIGFTTAGLFDFIYCTPEATFGTPFMKSF